MKKKKTVKRVVKKSAKAKPVRKAKAATESAPSTATPVNEKDFARHAMQLGQQNITVLNHILELLKAQVFDAFRQFTAGAIHAGVPPRINSFILLFKASITLHGITPEQLVAALDPVAQEIVMEALVESTKDQKKAAPAAPAAGVDLSGFGLGESKTEPVKEAPKAEPVKASAAKAAKTETPAKAEKGNGVFSSLDVL